MDHRLQTPEGKKLYALRKETPEPVFGIIKSVLGFRQFLLRGLDNVRGEWNLARWRGTSSVCLSWQAQTEANSHHSIVNCRRWPARCESRQHHLSSNRFCPFESPHTLQRHAVATNDRQSLASSRLISLRQAASLNFHGAESGPVIN